MSAHHQDKAALVTGGTEGIGKEIARGLARAGMRVIIVGRDREKGARAEQELRHSTQNRNVDFLEADLSLIREVRRLANCVIGRWPVLHRLVHVAGIVRGRRVLTAEGIESNFAVNYLSRFALTGYLLPLLEATGRTDKAAARIVVVSGAARRGTIYFDDVNLTSNFSTPRVVLQSCHANDVFTVEQAHRLAMTKAAAHVTINCLKLGVVKTGIRKEFPWWMKLLVPLVLDPLLAQTPSDAAAAALKLLLSEEFENVSGALFLKIRKFKRVSTTSLLHDPQEAEQLWEMSRRLVGNAITVATAGSPDDDPRRRHEAGCHRSLQI